MFYKTLAMHAAGADDAPAAANFLMRNHEIKRPAGGRGGAAARRARRRPCAAHHGYGLHKVLGRPGGVRERRRQQQMTLASIRGVNKRL